MAYSEKERRHIMLAVRIVGEFGAAIAVPVVVFTMFGKWLDGRYGTRPIFIISSFVVSAVVTSVMVYRRAHELNREMMAIDASERLSRKRDVDTPTV